MIKKEYAINALPELPLEPLELAGKLEHAGTAPVLTIKAHKKAAPQPPAKPSAKAKKSEAYRRKYLTQVTYPKVVCYPQNELSDRVAWKISNVEENERDVEVIGRYERFYKLSSFDAVKLEPPYFCTVHYGPWSAVVIEEESCDDGVPSFFRLFIASIPDVVLAWYGTWDDIPSYPSLHVFKGLLYLVDEGFSCCPGFQWCITTNSCIPLTVKCEEEPSPV